MSVKQLLRVIGSVAVVHLGVLSVLFGPRRIEYALAAYFSAVFLWGIAFLLGGQRRVVIWIPGAAVAIVIQQVAYRTMIGEDFGFWWPLIQFAALHFLFVMAARAIASSGTFVAGRCEPHPSR